MMPSSEADELTTWDVGRMEEFLRYVQCDKNRPFFPKIARYGALLIRILPKVIIDQNLGI
jgi:hypothetical protein